MGSESGYSGTSWVSDSGYGGISWVSESGYGGISWVVKVGIVVCHGWTRLATQ